MILENVKNILSHDEGRTIGIIERALEEAGYSVRYEVLDTATITGIPQHRERVYFVCFREKERAERFIFPHTKIEKRKISDFLEDAPAEKYYYTAKLKVFPVVEAGVVKDIRIHNTLYQYRRTYVRENRSNECPTLTANMGTAGHNCPLLKEGEKGIRKLTPRECFRLQGFPDSYVFPPKLSDGMLYKLAGNAVSVPVVKLLMEEVMKVLL